MVLTRCTIWACRSRPEEAAGRRHRAAVPGSGEEVTEPLGRSTGGGTTLGRRW